MAETKQTIVMEVGKRYRGSALLNENGDYEFHPYKQTGEKRPSPFRVLSGADDECPIQIKKSKTQVRIILTADLLQGAKERENEFRELFVKALQKLKKYEL